MINYQVDMRVQNEWVAVENWVRPFQSGETLDETLDIGQIFQSFVKSDITEPFNVLRLTSTEDGKVLEEIYLLVSDMTSEQQTFA